MAWQRRIVTLTFVLVVGALGLWAAKTHQSIPLGEECRYGFQCVPVEGYAAPTCVGEDRNVCAIPCDQGCPSGTSCDGNICR